MFSLMLLGFDWPVEEKILMSTFGGGQKGHFQTGIELGGTEQEVFSIAEGEIIFYFQESIADGSLPRGIGSFIVVLHEGGIQSVYTHLNTSSLNLASNGNSDQGGPLRLGVSGDTGMSEGVHLGLMIIDLEEGRFLNPIKPDKSPLQPPLEVPETRVPEGPIIANVSIKRDGLIEPLHNNAKLSSGEVEVLAEIYDKSEFVPFNMRMAPYRIYLSVAGEVITVVEFDSLKQKGNRLVPAGSDRAFGELYFADWIYHLGRINLVEGKTLIQVGAEDFAGQETTIQMEVEVQSP